MKLVLPAAQRREDNTCPQAATLSNSVIWRALRAIEATGTKAKVVLERGRMTVVPLANGDEQPAESGELEHWMAKHEQG